MRNLSLRNSNNSIMNTLIVLAIACVLLYKFIRCVVNAGRLWELLISTPIFFGLLYLSDCLMHNFYYGLNLKIAVFFWGIPTLIYALYWFILLNFCPKITCEKVNLKWTDENYWWNLTGWEFEEEVARVFRLNGYKARVTKKTGDGGVDIIMYKNDYKYIVQCKHYQNQVPVETMRALNGVKQDFGADILIMVASSGITKAGKEFIQDKPYFKVYTLKDIVRMGLRPAKKGVEDTEDDI